MLRIGNILRLKDPRSKNWLPKTTGEYEDCCQNLQQLRQDLLLGSKGGDEIVYQSPGSITTSRDWVEFVLKSGGGGGHYAMKPSVILKQKNPEFSKLPS